MTGGSLSLGARLRQERCRRGWSQRQMALRLFRAADEQTRARLPCTEHVVRRIVGYEGDAHRPRDPYAELYCRAFGIPRELLFGAAGGDPADSLPLGADADGLASWITSSNTTSEAVMEIELAMAALAVQHTGEPPRRVLAGVMAAHCQVQVLLHSGRQRLRQTRDLMRIDAGLLAHASLLLEDLGQGASARAHGHAAMLFAEEAGASKAMSFSAQAKTARWQGARRGGPAGRRLLALSAGLACEGFETASRADPVRVLLACQQASAAALLGDASAARQAIRRAEEEAADAGAAGAGVTAWSCPRPRFALYALSVALRLRDPDAALRSAAVAQHLWEAGEPRAFGVWSLIQAGAGIAHVMKGDLAAAAERLALVASLPPELRITTGPGSLRDMDVLLRDRRLGRTQEAGSMREQIAWFMSGAGQ